MFTALFAAKTAIVRYGFKQAIASECRRREDAEKERKKKRLLIANGALSLLKIWN